MKKTTCPQPAICRKCFITIVSLLLVFVSFSQERAQADVNITAVTLSGARPSRPTTIGEFSSDKNKPGAKIVPPSENIKCVVTVNSYWDDDASQAKLIVVLPVEVSIVSYPSNATVYKAGGTSPWAGYIVFNLGDMAVNQNITVEFVFSKSTTGNNKVSAYAYSATPDPNPSNNYKEATY